MTPLATRRLRYRLLAATSLVCAGAAFGQYQAVGTPVDSTSAIVAQGAGTTTITVSKPTAVINWVPNAAINTTNNGVPLTVQTGGTATFNGTADFVVLNRFLPTDTTRAIRFNGATNSLVNGQPGGTLWFYSPGGIILGSGANFNVGSLLLSASDIAYDPSGSITTPNQAQFLGSQAANFNPHGIVRLEPGAVVPQITASNYVAMFAPKIEQTGYVRAGGSVAYVAAERGTLTFPSTGGLFTISVDEGSDAGSLIHNGITTGPQSAAARGIYFVAVPKNNAISMLLRGSIGYDQAVGATTVGDTVVLSGNSFVSGTAPGDLPNNPFQTPLNIFGQDLTINGNLLSSSTGFTFDANPSLISVLGDTTIQAGNTLFANNPGGVLSFGGGLTINGFYGTPGSVRSGGSVNINIANGSLLVGRALNIDVSSLGQQNTFMGQQGLGGNVTFSVLDSTLSTGLSGTANAQSLVINADGRGGPGRFGGLGQGGIVNVDVSGSVVNVPGDFTVSASGTGGPAGIPSPVPDPVTARAGDGVGGTINFATDSNDDAGSLTVPGSIRLTASGTGGTAGPGFGGKPGGEDGGNGYGGTILATLGQGLVSTTNFILSTMGIGGAGGNATGGDFSQSMGVVVSRNAGRGGIGRAGDATLTVNDRLEADFVQLLTSGTGGAGGTANRDTQFPPTNPAGRSGNGGNGGSGSGEKATLTINPNGVFSRRSLGGTAGTITLDGHGTGGAGGNSADGVGGFGGFASGGEAILQTLGGALDTGQIFASTYAAGGNGGGTGANARSGGTATGGAVAITADGGGTTQGIAATVTTVNASATQGRGGVFTVNQSGQPTYVSDQFQNSYGGAVTVTANDAGLALGDLVVSTYATQLRPNGNPLDDPSTTNYVAPLNTNGIGMTGGKVSIAATNAAELALDSLGIDTRGVAPDAVTIPGDGHGGAVNLLASGASTLNVLGNDSINTRGFGGNTTTLLTVAGNGFGGGIAATAGEDGSPGGTIGLGSAFFTSGATGGSVPVTPPPPPPPPPDQPQPPPPPPTVTAGGAIGGDILLHAGFGGTLTANGIFAQTNADGGKNSDILAAQVRGGNFTLSADSANFAIDDSLVARTQATSYSTIFNNDAQSGDIEISVTGDATNVPASYVGIAGGQVFLDNSGAGASAMGNTLISNTVTNGAGPLELRGDLSIRSFGFNTGAGTRFVSDTGRIHVVGNADVNNFVDTSVEATGDGGLDVDGALSMNALNFTATHDNNTNGVDTVFADDLNIFTYGSIFANAGSILRGATRLNLDASYDVFADYLRAGDELVATAQHSLNVRDVAATDAVFDRFGNADPAQGTVLLRQAYDGSSPGSYTDGELRIGIVANGNTPAIAGSVRGPGNITIQSGTSIYTEDGTQIVAGNGLTIQSADDIRLAGVGGVVRSGDLTQLTDNASLTVGAGVLPGAAGLDGPGNVRALIMDAALSAAANGTITLSGDAVQADAGSITTGGDLFVRLVDGDDGNGVGTGGTPLRPECGDGTVCLGQLNVDGTITVGSGIGSETPSLVRFRQDTAAGGFDVRARTIALGDGSPITLASNGSASFVATTGSIVAPETTLTTVDDLTLNAADAIEGSTLNLNVGNDFMLGSGGNATIRSAVVGGALRGLAGQQVAIGGALDIGYLDTRSGNIDITAAGITLGDVRIGADNDLTLATTNFEDVTVGTAVTGVNGRALNISITGGNITADQLEAAGTVYLNGLGAVQVTTDLNTGSVLAYGGSVDLTARGGLNIQVGRATSANGGSGNFTATSGGDLNADDVQADSNLSLTSGGVLSIGNATAGGTLDGLADGDVSFGNVNAGVTNLTSLGGNIAGDSIGGGTVTLNAPGSIRVNTDLATGALYATGSEISVDSQSDYTVADATATSGDIHFGSAGSVTVQQANAAGNFDAAADVVLGLGTVTAGGAITGRGDQGVSFDYLAGSSVDLTSADNGITGTTIKTNGAATLNAGNAVTVTGLSAGSVDAVGSSVTLTSPGALNITRVNATDGDATLTSADTLNLVNTTATGAISATSQNGAVLLNDTAAIGALTARAATGITFGAIRGQAIDLQTSGGGITGTGLRTPGTARLVAAGAVDVGNEVTASSVTASGSSIALNQTAGALNIAQATATAGDANLTSTGNLTLDNTTASGAIRATSKNGTVQLTNAVANGALIVRAATGIGFGVVGGSSIDAESVTGDFNIANIASPGTIRVVTGGRITVSNSIAAGGGITARGLNLDLRNNLGTLNVTSATATGGSISLTGRDGITVGDATATGAILGAAGSGAAITAGTLNAGGQVLLNGNGVAFGTITAGSISIQGNNGAITGNGTVTTGDQRFLTTGAVAITNVGVGTVSLASGSSVLLRGTGPLTIGSAVASGGDATLSAGGALNINTATATGALSATSTGGSVTAGTLSAGGAATINGATGASFTSLRGSSLSVQGGSGGITGGTTITTGAQSFQANGAIAIAALDVGATTARGSSVTLTAPGALNIASATATAGNVTLRSGGAVAITAADATGTVDVATTNGAVQLGTTNAGGSVKTRATNGIGFTRVSGSSIDLASTAGDIAGTRLGATGAVALDTIGAITVGQVDSGAITAHAGSITLTATGALNVVDAQANVEGIMLRSGGDLTLGTATARKFIDVASTGGAATIGDARISAPVGTLAQSPAATNPSTGAITIAAATTATLNGTVSATGPLDVTGANIALNGASSGATASFHSGAIAIGGNALVVSPGLVTFQNNGTQRTSIGGAATTGYALTSAGLGRVRGGSIAVTAPAVAGSTATQPDVTIGDLTLHGTTPQTPGNIGVNGSFTVATPGLVQVVGNALLTDASSSNAMILNGGMGIGVTLPTGSLRVTNSTGGLAGAIELSAPRIVIATATAATDIAAATTSAARTTRLATNDTGTTSDAGGISADRLKFSVSNGLYIQNTGGAARADRRGFTAGAGGVDIVGTGTTPAEFVINGIIGTTTGDAVLAALRLTGQLQTGVANFVGGSSANSCTLDQGCPAIVQPVPPIVGTPAQDIVAIVTTLGIEDPLAIQSAVNPQLPPLQAPLIELARSQPFSVAPSIEEPVTGAGNDSLWTGLGIGVDDGSDGATTGTGNDPNGDKPRKKDE